jgi:hypothetical protein
MVCLSLVLSLCCSPTILEREINLSPHRREVSSPKAIQFFDNSSVDVIASSFDLLVDCRLSIKPSSYSLRSIPYSVHAIDRKMKEMPENAVEKMECGTSLAELEYYGGQMDVPRKEESSSDSPSLGLKEEAPGNPQSIDSLRSLMASDVLKDGANLTTFSSPFEVPRGVSNPSEKRYLDLPLVYCDQTASNRPVKSIEKYMEDVCLPFYGNTHTNTSITGSQSTAFVAEARQIVAEETNAKITGKASLDVVLFA